MSGQAVATKRGFTVTVNQRMYCGPRRSTVSLPTLKSIIASCNMPHRLGIRVLYLGGLSKSKAREIILRLTGKVAKE